MVMVPVQAEVCVLAAVGAALTVSDGPSPGTSVAAILGGTLLEHAASVNRSNGVSDQNLKRRFLNTRHLLLLGLGPAYPFATFETQDAGGRTHAGMPCQAVNAPRFTRVPSVAH